VIDSRATSDYCGSAACSIRRQGSGYEETTDAGTSFSSAPTMVGTPEAWVIPTMPKMPFQMECLGDSEGGGKKTVRRSPYIEELDSSNSSSFELMPTENGSVGKEDRYASPVREMVLDGTGSSYVVPAVLSIKRRPVWTFLYPLHAHLSATNHLQMLYSFPITVYHMPRHVPHTYIN